MTPEHEKTLEGIELALEHFQNLRKFLPSLANNDVYEAGLDLLKDILEEER